MANDHITWAGRTLSGKDRFGEWIVTSIKGVWYSPGVKGETDDRPNADGEYDLPTYKKARILSLSGTFHARSHAELHEAGIFLTGATRGRFQVVGHGPTQWADAKVDGEIEFDPETDTLATWVLVLKCPDPRKFGDVQSFTLPANTPTVVFHRGNYEATPVITVSGSMPGGYTLTVAGWNYAVSVPLVSGTPHVIDYNDGRLRINGSVVQNSIGNTNLATIPPGESVTCALYATSGGTGSAVMKLPDTYI